MTKVTSVLTAAAMVVGVGFSAHTDTQGVSDTEVVIGSVNDLSGIFAAVGD